MMSLARACEALADAYYNLGDPGRCAAHLEKALEAATRLGEPTTLAYMRRRRAWYAWATGDWAEARRQLETASDIDREMGVT